MLLLKKNLDSKHHFLIFNLEYKNEIIAITVQTVGCGFDLHKSPKNVCDPRTHKLHFPPGDPWDLPWDQIGAPSQSKAFKKPFQCALKGLEKI